MVWSKLRGLLALGCVPFAVFACVMDSTSSGCSSVSAVGGAVGTPTETGPSGDGAPSAHPMNGVIDTNQTMNVKAGLGVGVFVEYDSGGNWNVWWTCDTTVDPTNPACAFDVKVTAQTGAIENVASQSLGTGDTVTQPTTSSLEAITSTTTGNPGFTFSTTPGAEILLDATVGGQHDGAFIFWVQDGVVDDGYQGTPTDPIYMQGSTP